MTVARPAGWDRRAHHALAWTAAVGIGFLGLGLAVAGHGIPGTVLFALGSTVIALLALLRSGAAVEPARAVFGATGLGMFAGGGLVAGSLSGVAPGLDLPLVASGAQLLLLVLTTGPAGSQAGWGRTVVPLAGHGLVLLGSLWTVQVDAAVPHQARLAYISGFSLLILEAFWEHRSRRQGREGLEAWEGAFLGLVSLALATVALVTSLEAGELISGRGGELATLGLVQGLTVLSLALLAGPPRLPRALRSQEGSLARLLADAASFTALFNVLMLTIFLTARWSVRPLFYLLLGWLGVAVLFEWVSVAHALRGARPWRRGAPPDARIPELTVVVPAKDEADNLARITRQNLSRLPGRVRFLLVPSLASEDGTMEQAQALAAEHPERVRVLGGTGGSKADDLNQAWSHIDTDLVLLLDADESVDTRSLRWGLARFREDPRVGIVQGRKRARGQPSGLVDRMACVERRFSTLLDQSLQSDLFDAAHFAGSAALVRHEVPYAVGGWSDATLTEDIDLTMRLYLGSHWRILYEPRMEVEEATPADLRALVRQRGRWARGWGQVYALHMGQVLRSWRRVGLRRTTGLTWQLVTSISAPWSIFLPALALLWLAGTSPLLPATVAVALGVLILPARGASYLLASLRDPSRRVRRTPGRVLEVLGLAYLWIVLGWFLQLQALYLEVSQAPRTWFTTEKSGLDAG